MEYKVSTIVAMVIFAGLFVVALIFVQLDSPPKEEGEPQLTAAQKKNLPKVEGVVPDPDPDNIDEDADTEYRQHKSGIRYKVLRKSSRPKPTTNDAVAVAYKGWTKDGKVFDQSYRRDPPYYPLNPPWNVIQGWKEGIPLVGEGGMLEIEIPADLAYGKDGSGSIGPNETLWFKVEILKIFKKKND